MKIIHRGTPPGEKVYAGTCHSCMTHVEYKRSEAEVSNDQRDNGATFVKCPVCPGTIWGKEKQEDKPNWYAGRN